MKRRRAEVTWKKMDNDRLPDALAEGTALVLDLGRREVLEEVGRRIRIRREGGYCGFDVVLLLLFFFAAGSTVGIRKFWDLVRPWARKLAATADRKRLPSPASLSRALDAVDPELVRPASEWLLSEGANIDTVLRHPSVLTYDGRGNGWHVFDFDPTVTTLRHRALPEVEDLPAARRRSARMAAPGFAGRKRGDVQFRRGTLQHAGSSAWLHASLGPGNGDGHAELLAALDVVVRTCRRLDHPLLRALLRMDGAFGWLPYLAACRARGIPFLTRLTRYELIEQPEVVRALREGTWHYVADSCSGPRRSALDLGIVTVPPGRTTHRPDGTPYEPVAVRVVVSRYPRTGEAEHGRVRDGWQYELFAVDVAVDALPAPDVVATYFGRAGQENRFAQEDREVGLDRIFSYHLPGQELAVVVGLWVWNLRLARGFELAPPPAVRPAQQPYVAQPDARGIAGGAGVPLPEPPDTLPPSPDQAPSDPAQGDAVPHGRDPDDRPVCDGPTGGDQKSEAPSGHTPETSSSDAERAPRPSAEAIVDELRQLDWEHALRQRAGWSWDAVTGHLRCPAGRDLVLTTVRQHEHAPGRTGIIFCRPKGGCYPCDVRSTCLRSAEPRTPKHARLSVPTHVAARLRELLIAHRRTRPAKDAARRPTRAPAMERRPPPSFPVAPLPPAAALLAVLPSLFLPAAARHLLRSVAASLAVVVAITEPTPRTRLVLVADSVAHKQHRRKTWQQHFERNALDPDARVRIEIAGDTRLRLMVGAAGERAVA